MKIFKWKWLDAPITWRQSFRWAGIALAVEALIYGGLWGWAKLQERKTRRVVVEYEKIPKKKNKKLDLDGWEEFFKR